MSHSATLLQGAAARLSVLTGVHFLADFFSCLLPGFLPLLLRYFGLPLNVGILVVAFIGTGANLLQLPAAMLDRTVRSPRTLVIGLLLASLILYIGLLPETTPAWALAILMLLIGSGVAIVHPHGLRGVQSIGTLSPTVSTPAFMTGGFTGAAFAPWIASLLVGNFGMRGLLWLTIPLAAALIGIRITGIRLAVEFPTPAAKEKPAKDISPWSFRNLFCIALLMNIATTLYQYLLPTYLHGLGYELSFGGFCLMLFGAGSAVGSMALGAMIRRRNPAPFVLTGFAVGIPLTMLYFFFPRWGGSWLLSLGIGLLVSSEFPLLVSFARNVSGSGLGLGMRLAGIVGGTWGLAGVAFMGFGQLADRIGLDRIMHFTWIFYLAAFCWALFSRRGGRSDGAQLLTRRRTAVFPRRRA